MIPTREQMNGITLFFHNPGTVGTNVGHKFSIQVCGVPDEVEGTEYRWMSGRFTFGASEEGDDNYPDSIRFLMESDSLQYDSESGGYETLTLRVGDEGLYLVIEADWNSGEDGHTESRIPVTHWENENYNYVVNNIAASDASGPALKMMLRSIDMVQLVRFASVLGNPSEY